MLANNLLKSSLKAAVSRKQSLTGIVYRSAHHSIIDPELVKIGDREIVGYGMNGDPNYIDRPEFPFPAIRFKSINSAELQTLKEKEKGDWRELNKEDKKALYRASFRQTFAEMDAPSGEWKSISGWSLVFISMSFWILYGIKYYGFGPLPKSLDPDRQSLQLQRLLDMEHGVIEGLSSNYDYEKETWKNN